MHRASRCVCGGWEGGEGQGWLTPKDFDGEMPLVLSKGTSNHTKTINNKMHTQNEKVHPTSTSFHKKKLALIMCASYSKNRVI